jgi:LemA protein
MDGVQIAALVAAAVISFWMLGAYNRLIGLRNDINAAFVQLDEAMAQRSQAALALVTALREPMPHEHGMLDALLNAATLLQQARAAMKLRPAAAETAGPLAGASSDFSAVGGRVRALAEQQSGWRPELAGEVAQQLAAWRDAEARITFTRELFNQVVTSYNEAAAQFPTRLVARACGLAPAGLI